MPTRTRGGATLAAGAEAGVAALREEEGLPVVLLAAAAARRAEAKAEAKAKARPTKARAGAVTALLSGTQLSVTAPIITTHSEEAARAAAVGEEEGATGVGVPLEAAEAEEEGAEAEVVTAAAAVVVVVGRGEATPSRKEGGGARPVGSARPAELRSHSKACPCYLYCSFDY